MNLIIWSVTKINFTFINAFSKYLLKVQTHVKFSMTPLGMAFMELLEALEVIIRSLWISIVHSTLLTQIHWGKCLVISFALRTFSL